MEKYTNYSDEKLIALYRTGDMSAVEQLIEKYKPLVLKNTHKLFLIGAEKDDLIQEGMVGLFKAIRDYSSDKEASFYTFAELCISRQMISAFESSNRKKHSPLNSYISISADSSEGGIAMEEVIEGEAKNPEELVIEQEFWKEIQVRLDKELSSMEKSVLRFYLEGNNYIEIAERLGKEPKSIDNAIQRIRKKIKTISLS